MSSNPYAAPKAPVADAKSAPQGDFIPAGRGVAAGRGWDWIVSGWEIFKKQPGMWIGLVVVGMVIFIVVGIIPLVGSLALAVLGPVFAGGVVLGCRALDEGGELEIGHLFAGFKDKLGTLAAVGALNLVAQIVIMLVVMLIGGVGMFAMLAGSGGEPSAGATAGAMLGMLLAVLIALALMLPVAMAVWFAPALVVMNERGAVEAMKESFSGCLKNIVPFLLYGIVLMVAGVIAMIPIFLGLLVLLPVVAGSIYASYRDIYYSS
jgi:uncharacterized membrane protein